MSTVFGWYKSGDRVAVWEEGYDTYLLVKISVYNNKLVTKYGKETYGLYYRKYGLEKKKYNNFGRTDILMLRRENPKRSSYLTPTWRIY